MKTLYKIVLLLAFVLLSAGLADAQSEREKGIEYYLKGDYQNAVEILRRVVENDDKNRDGWMYLGLSFARLKKDDKAVDAFKKAENLPAEEVAVDEKNVNILLRPRAGYTDSARTNQVKGTVALAVEFGEGGQLKFIFAFQKLPQGLTESAIDAVSKIKFEPATKNGKAVSSVKILKYSFTIY
jgi:tetratricopeptide (TPR) repeat protein